MADLNSVLIEGTLMGPINYEYTDNTMQVGPI